VAVYDWYVDRGEPELWIKDLKRACFADRLSCHRFAANQFRLLLHAAAYWPLDTLRRWLCQLGVQTVIPDGGREEKDGRLFPGLTAQQERSLPSMTSVRRGHVPAAEATTRKDAAAATRPTKSAAVPASLEVRRERAVQANWTSWIPCACACSRLAVGYGRGAPASASTWPEAIPLPPFWHLLASRRDARE
jgi:Transposase DDE domain group 1